jgi:hypothetical protein
MSRFVVVSRERHGRMKWLHFNSYNFAAATDSSEIVGAELARAATVSMPCAFVQHSGRYTLVAVLSLIPGRNMFVGPGGRWLAPYVPAYLRLYPFRMVAPEGTDQRVLGVDEESGLVVKSGAAGEDFFDSEGNYEPALKRLFDACVELERARAVSDVAVAALAQAGVIRPWQITVKSEQGEKPISGLHTIDETALRALPDDVFLKLRTTSALPIAYAQMLSAAHIGVFGQLSRLLSQQAPPPVRELPETIDGLLEDLKDKKIRFN